MSSAEAISIADISLVRQSDALADSSVPIREWTGLATLSAWAGYSFGISEETYPQLTDTSSGKAVEVVVKRLIPLSDEHFQMQSAALSHFLTHQAAIKDKMLSEIWKVVINNYQDAYDDIVSPEQDNMMTWEAVEEKANNPTAEDLKTLKPMMGLHRLTVWPTDGKIPVQISLQFECEWDEGHGLEVLVEGSEVIEVESADSLELLACRKLLY